MIEKLKDIICDFANVKPEEITEDTNIRTDLALDSLSLVNLAVAIEDEFELEISDKDVMGIETVGDLLKMIEDNC